MKHALVLLCSLMLYTTNIQAGVQPDSTIVKNLNDSFEHNIDSYPAKAYRFADEALKVSVRSDYNAGMAASMLNMGNYYRKNGEYQRAIGLFSKSLSIAKQLDLTNVSGLDLLYMGYSYLKLGKMDSSMFCYKQSLALFSKNRNTRNRIRSNNSIGFLYESWHKPDSALKFYRESELLLNSTKDPDVSATTYNKIGNVYYETRHLKSALEYYTKTLEQYELSGNLTEIAGTYDNIGNVWSDSGNFNLAISYYKKSLDIKEKLGDKEGIMEALVNMGVANNDHGYLAKDKNCYYKALGYYFQALPLARQLKASQAIMDIYKNIYKVYRNTNQFEKAFEYLLLYDQLKDSLYNEQNSKAMAQLLVQYETEKKQSQIQLLQQQRAIEQNKMRMRNLQLYGTLAGLAFVIILSVLLLINYRQRMRAQAVLNDKRVDELLKDQELKSINAMMLGQDNERKRIAEDLHDRLGSLLSTVKLHFASFEKNLKSKDIQIPQYASANLLLDEACDEVRRIAHNMLSGVLVQFGLVPALQEMAESIESSSEIKVKVIAFGLDERLENTAEIEIYRIIQELVSNILKHARATEVVIQLTRQKELLNIMVEDNGQGFNITEIKTFKGIGLKNMAYRTERINGSFNIDSYPGKGTTAIIEIPA